MASARKPLVLNANKEVEQLQAGDTLLATVSGGDNFELVNGSGATLSAGTAVYAYTSSATVKKAFASNVATYAEARVIGLAMAEIASPGTGAICQAGNLSLGDPLFWDPITDEVPSGGLTIGAVYYLSATPGNITTTPPSTGYVTKIGIALNTDLMFVNIESPIKL